MTNEVGTLHYRAPELFLGETRYTKAVDVWGAGCIFYELLKKKVLFQGKSDAEMVMNIWALLSGKSLYTHPNTNKYQLPTPDEALKQKTFEGLAEDALDLLSRLLDLNPKTRIKP